MKVCYFFLSTCVGSTGAISARSSQFRKGHDFKDFLKPRRLWSFLSKFLSALNLFVFLLEVWLSDGKYLRSVWIAFYGCFYVSVGVLLVF